MKISNKSDSTSISVKPTRGERSRRVQYVSWDYINNIMICEDLQIEELLHNSSNFEIYFSLKIYSEYVVTRI